LYAPLPEKQKHLYVVSNKCFTLAWNTAAGKKWEALSVINPTALVSMAIF
jgi:hypothetical protein